MDVVVFCYNRADKLKMCLEAINVSYLDTLWVFCDAAKNEAQAEAVQRNYEVARDFPWENKRVILRPNNFGTPKNVISGLDEVFSVRDSCLVLEDDCIVKPEAYAYIDWALKKYRGEPSVFSVNTMSPLNGLMNRLASAFIKEDVVASSRVFAFWGWATWADRWKEFRGDLEPFRNPYGSASKTPLSFGVHIRWTLEQFEQGKVGGWDARLAVLVGHAKRLHLYPKKSLMRNIGLDGSGSHFLASQNRITDWRALQYAGNVPMCAESSMIKERKVVAVLNQLSMMTIYARSKLFATVPKSLKLRVRLRFLRRERDSQY